MKIKELSAGSVFSKNGNGICSDQTGIKPEYRSYKEYLSFKRVGLRNITLVSASIRAFMNTDILHDMESVFGASNILYSETDMTSLDGRTYYGKYGQDQINDR